MISPKLFHYHQKSEDQRLVAFKGPFEPHIISAFGNFVLNYTDDNKKLFKIFIELAQNVAFYSAEQSTIEDKTVGIGSIALGSEKEIFSDHYVLSIGNIIEKEDFDILNKKCQLINSLNREELREYKRQNRALLPGTKDNAHIGLIMCALMTNAPIEIIEEKIDEKLSFFTLNLIIDKQTALLNEI
jgi:hypothetical protein